MNEKKEMWCLEYSKSQGYFHIQELEKSLRTNKRFVEEYLKGDDFVPDYIILAISDDYDYIHTLTDKYHDNKQMYKRVKSLF